MRLKLQMVVAGLVSLAIPIVGWHSIRQLDDALEESRRGEQQLRVNNAVASLSTNEPLMQLLQSRVGHTDGLDLYAPYARFPVFVDGYADDWREFSTPISKLTKSSDDLSRSTGVNVKSSVRNNTLYLFIDVADNNVVFHQPPPLVTDYAEGEEPDFYEQVVNGDALELLIQQPSGDTLHGLFRATAPGPVIARVASNSNRRKVGDRLSAWQGHWSAEATGFQLELSIPLPADGSTFGLAYVDVDKRGDDRTHWVGSLDPAVMAQRHRSNITHDADPKLHRVSNEAFDALSPWVTPATRARLFDAQGRLLADVSQLYEQDHTQTAFDPAKSNLWDALVFRFVSAMLRDRNGEYSADPLYQRVDDLHMPLSTLSETGPLKTARRYQTDEADFVMGTLGALSTAPVSGYLLFESNDSRATSYAGSRLAQLMSLLTLVSLAVGGSLLTFATVLSFRIRRLSKQAARAVSNDGRVNAFAPSSAKDEIGELSRTLSDLLGRTQHYTHYLEALSSRLSHELRTPLSVVKTSLENIDEAQLDDQTLKLVNRANGGAEQLGHIIRALVESTRLEQTVQQAQKGPIPVKAFLEGALIRYQQVHPTITFEAMADDVSDKQTVFASPELLQQALDKLVDNAVSFTSDNSISLGARTYNQNDTQWVIFSVNNPGQLSDKVNPTQVFDPMFSSREDAHDELHLGLGLYIVRMVAEAHSGHADMSQNGGVVTVSMAMPTNVHEVEDFTSN